MSLSGEDRSWMQAEFNRLHDRINKSNSDAAHDKQELLDRIQKSREDHEEKHHDALKRLSFFGGISTVILALWEILKMAIAAARKGGAS